MSNDNWSKEKSKYISKIKNGIKYVEKNFINADKKENKKQLKDLII